MEALTEPWNLSTLIFHWGSAYKIRRYGDESWVAHRRDGMGTIRADTADNLVVAIRLDYQISPVPRQYGRKD